MITPYLSVVCTARNDNYGGNLLHRLQCFLDSLAPLLACERGAELIVVEWNPPTAQPRLSEAVAGLAVNGQARIRFVEVPRSVHESFPNHDCMSVFEYIAKNVGIRRARGQFVLSTNPDLIFSGELVEFLATASLGSDAIYLIPRYDVPRLVPLELEPNERVRFCKRHWNCCRTRYGPHSRRLRTPVELKRYVRWILYRCAPWFFRFRGPQHGPNGDFTLMNTDNWHKLKAYPELPTHGAMDNFLASMAMHSGLRQVWLRRPLRLFHMEHDRSAHSRRPPTDTYSFSPKRESANAVSWGLSEVPLPEVVQCVGPLPGLESPRQQQSVIA